MHRGGIARRAVPRSSGFQKFSGLAPAGRNRRCPPNYFGRMTYYSLGSSGQGRSAISQAS
jgi:hypothetical protein